MATALFACPEIWIIRPAGPCFGGDEFVVIVSDLDAKKHESLLQAGRVAEKIRASLAHPYVLSAPQDDGSAVVTVEHHCSVSIGITLFFNFQESAEEVLKLADMAMHDAKEAGRNTVRFLIPTRTGDQPISVNA